MIRYLGTAARVTILSIVVLGIGYPLAMTGLAQVLFPYQAGGSMATDARGIAIGSKIIGESWKSARYFHGRPSAAGSGYDPTATGGTNLGPTSKRLIASTAATLRALRRENAAATVPVPMDLVTSSGSGIDPDISPEAAYYQAPRIAKARAISVEDVDRAIGAVAQGREFGFLGEPRVNVLRLNLALDASAPR